MSKNVLHLLPTLRPCAKAKAKHYLAKLARRTPVEVVDVVLADNKTALERQFAPLCSPLTRVTVDLPAHAHLHKGKCVASTNWRTPTLPPNTFLDGVERCLNQYPEVHRVYFLKRVEERIAHDPEMFSAAVEALPYAQDEVAVMLQAATRRGYISASQGA